MHKWIQNDKKKNYHMCPLIKVFKIVTRWALKSLMATLSGVTVVIRQLRTEFKFPAKI